MKTALLSVLLGAALLGGCRDKGPELPQQEEPEDPCPPPLPPPPLFGSTSVTVFPFRRAAVYNPRNAQEVVYVMDTVDLRRPGFVGLARHLWVRNLATGRERRLLTDIVTPGSAAPDWSRTGWLAAVRMDGQIYKIKSNGDSLTRLTNLHSNQYPTWSPDGQLMAYQRTTNDVALSGIVICRADGTTLRLITDAEVSTYGSLAWSPDGRRLAFLSTLNRPVDQPVLSTYNLDQNTMTQLTPMARNTYDVSLRWLPNGQEIVWSHGQQGVFITNVATQQTRLVRAVCPGGSRSFAYACPSPDGQRLLMTRADASANAGGSEITYRASWETTNLDGKAVRKVSF